MISAAESVSGAVRTIGVLAALLGARAAMANNPPATPIVTEPQVGRIVNAADAHMECAPFSDPDAGDTHLCSDWEIWTVTPAERVWFTSCIGGVERVHTHLGDGVFQGSYAGRQELLPDTQYRLRIRHRDSSGDAGTEWSAYGERLFTSGPASRVFPLETDDISPSPAPAWVTTLGAAIDLPTAAAQPSLRIESGTGDLLMQIAASPAAGNTVTDAQPLPAHTAVRLRISAGSLATPLALPETNLTFTTHEGTAHTLYLPALSIAPGAASDAYLWVSDAGSTYTGNSGQSLPDFSQLARGNPVPWTVRQSGYRVEVVATGFQLPVNIAFVPSPGNTPASPFYYVAELYGAIKVVTRDGTVHDYANNLLNFNPTGNFPGSGEQGSTGIVVDQSNGDVYATMLYSSVPGQEAVPHYPKVVRFTSIDGGLSAATQTTILNMTGETQGQSHQISNISFGPDGKLYVHMGDGFDAARAQDINSYRGKVLRLNKNGTAPTDNPFYNSGNGINARDYTFALGVRNPFGGGWRTSDGGHYQVENGPSIDRLVKIISARNYLYDGSDASMLNYAIYNWIPSCGPVNITFIQSSTFGGSGFPAAKLDHAFVSESGGTWATGPQGIGKKISEFVIDSAGNLVSGPTPLIEYAGSGKASVVGLTAGPDGLYFSDLYKDMNYASPIDRGANILRVRFVGDADFAADTTRGNPPLTVHFTDTSTVPGITSRLWEFGDGGTSTEVNPTHVYLDDGAYTVRLTVTGSTGAAVAERASYVRVGAVPRIALIGGGLPPIGADAAVVEHLAGLGYQVDAMDDEPANRPSAAQIAADYNLVLVSSTITSGNIAGEFRTAAVPMIFWENALLRTGRESLTDNGTVASASTISIVNNTHPITQGLPLGPLVVFQPAANMSQSAGTIGAGVQVLAQPLGSPNGAILAANAGAVGAAGYTTPARRVFLFFEDSSWLSSTAVARELLDRSICWAANLPAPAFDQHPQGAARCVGDSVQFSVHVTGPGPLTYAWKHDGQVIPGATGRTLTLANLAPADAGAYVAVVTNACGGATSNPAQLTVGGAGCCPADFNNDGFVDFFDADAFIAAFEAGEPGADFNHDGFIDFFDADAFIAAFEAGC